MEELEWSADQKAAAQAAVVERFQRNSVGDQFIPVLDVDWSETIVPWNRFDFQERRTVDQETLSLHEPYAIVELTRAQADEPSLTRALSTIHRAASALARWHDVLLFTGFEAGEKLKPRGVEMPQPKKAGAPVSLREAAMQAEKEEGGSPIPVPGGPQINEGLVKAVQAAVLRLEERGYYTEYHLALGEKLWVALHEPTAGSLVLPRDRIEPSLAGGGMYRTTAIPAEEALLISLDGPTLDRVSAGSPGARPKFEFLRAETDKNREEIYRFRIRERFAPRVRESHAVVRLATTS